MVKLISVVAFGLLLLQDGSSSSVQPPNQTQHGKQPSNPISLIAPKAGDGPALQYYPEHKCDEKQPCWVQVGKMPDRSWFDYVLFVTSLLLALVGIAGICVAKKTLDKIERQTAATEKQATHMVDSERPFIMVSTKGLNGSEFWMKNWGKSPAKIEFVQSFIPAVFVDHSTERQDYDLPLVPDYGPHYGMEQINVQWLAPQEERCFGFVNANGISEIIDEHTKIGFQTGHKAMFYFSSIRYKGLFSDAVYDSGFCYRWFQGIGTRMAGPYGYNKNT